MRTAAPSAGEGASVTIHGIAAGGDGVARLPDGRVVFVPRTAPGDEVEVVLRRVQPRWARGEVRELRSAGPGRIAPRCQHYVGDRCGGCQLQHLDASAQRTAKATIVGDALRRIGRLEVDDPDVEPAAQEWAYRHKVTLARDAAGRIGFHPLGRPEAVFDLAQCEIADPRLMQAWRAVRPTLETAPRGMERLVLRIDTAGDVHALVVAPGGAPWPEGEQVALGLAAADPAVLLWHDDGSGPVRLDGQPASGPRPTTFEQVAPAMGQRVRAWAAGALQPTAGEHAWDLYAGTGATSRLLREAGATVESVELDEHAVAAARGAPGIESHAGRVELLLPTLRPADLGVANPPRAGLAEEVTAVLDRQGPARLAYISCDPATLARDLRRLPGYRLARLRAFDLFPQTAHVETVAVLERAG